MPRILVHIGLPKTATSSLQIDFFEKIDERYMKYLGVRHPGDIIQNKLYYEIFGAITTGDGIDKTRNELANELSKGRDLIISEEMIVFNNWQSKITNLWKLVKGFDYIIIITLREPGSAIASYYVELYHIFSKKKKSFSQIALHDNAMKIYHYKIFFEYILNHFPSDRLVVLQFEKIIGGNLFDLEEIVPISREVKLEKRNSKKYSNEQILKVHRISLGQIIYSFSKWLNLTKLKKFKLAYKIMKFVFNLTKEIKFNRKYQVQKPKEDEINSIRLALNDQTKYLKDRFNIQYL